MPLEASADNIQMTTFSALALNSTAAAQHHMPLLRNLTEYLVQNGLDPAMQQLLWSINSFGPSQSCMVSGYTITGQMYVLKNSSPSAM